MYTIDDLNVKLLSELKDLAESMGIKNAKKLGKQELVYKILDEQAVNPPVTAPASKKAATTEAEPERKMRPRRRENVAPTPSEQPAPKEEEKEISSQDMLNALDIDLGSTNRFDSQQPNENSSEQIAASIEPPVRTENPV